MEALAELNVEVLAALGPVDAQEIGTVPGSVHVERFVDQARILPLVDAVVHHGGSGTTLGAAAQGLPQLILPTGADQKPNGEAVAAAGAGLMITPDVCDRVGIAQAVGSLLGEPQLRGGRAGDPARDRRDAVAGRAGRQPRRTSAGRLTNARHFALEPNHGARKALSKGGQSKMSSRKERFFFLCW